MRRSPDHHDQPPLPPPPLPRTVRLLIAARAVNALGGFSVAFLTVLLTQRFGATLATAGLVTGAFGLATIPSRLAGARLTEHLGPRATIVLGLVGCAAAQLGIALAPSLAVAALSAGALGFAFEIYEAPSQAVIADTAGAEGRVRAFSLFNAALGVGGVGSGLIAASLGHRDLRLLFVVDAVTCLACAAVMQAVVPGGRGGRPERKADAASPWRDRRLLALLASGCVFATVYMQLTISLPLSLQKRGLPPTRAGLLFTVAALATIAGQPILRTRRISAWSNRSATAVGYALLALGLIGLGIARALPMFAVPVLIVSAGNIILFGRLYAAAADLAPPGGEARYLAVFGLCWGVAGIAAPVIGTQLLQHAGVGALWFTLAACCAALAAPLLVRRGAPLTDGAQSTA